MYELEEKEKATEKAVKIKDGGEGELNELMIELKICLRRQPPTAQRTVLPVKFEKRTKSHRPPSL